MWPNSKETYFHNGVHLVVVLTHADPYFGRRILRGVPSSSREVHRGPQERRSEHVLGGSHLGEGSWSWSSGCNPGLRRLCHRRPISDLGARAVSSTLIHLSRSGCPHGSLSGWPIMQAGNYCGDRTMSYVLSERSAHPPLHQPTPAFPSSWWLPVSS